MNLLHVFDLKAKHDIGDEYISGYAQARTVKGLKEALGRQKTENCFKFEDSLFYLLRYRPSQSYVVRLCL